MRIQKQLTHGALLAPEYPKSLPKGCQWLGAEGYGVWFLLSKEKELNTNEYRIRRYSETGNLDCDRIFELDPVNNFNPNSDFEFGYISHCQKCTIYQNNIKYTFMFKKEFSEKAINCHA